MSHIEREISEQPSVIRRLLAEQSEKVRTVAEAIRAYNPAFVSIAARGTSDNAGRYAQYLLGVEARLPVALATPSVHTLYESAPMLARALVVGISQSGVSEDVCRVIQDAREQGALTLSITNDASSRIAQAAEYHIDMLAGEEISIAATKTYTAELMVIAMIAAALVDKATLHEALSRLPDYMAETIRQSESITHWVERYRYMQHFAAIGRGYNYCTAFEIGLKIKELCYVTGDQYSEADFRHGPIAIVQPGFPVIVIAPEGRPLAGLINLLDKLRERRAECLVISNSSQALAYARNQMPLPEMPEWLTPIAGVIPGQLYAMHLAIARGLPVDKPEGLTKVTSTL